MDKSEVIKVAREYAKAVAENYPYEQMILFGSFVKGSAHADSDIDIAVIFKDYDESIDMQLQLMRLTRKIDSRIEPHPFKESEFNFSNSLASEILKYGEPVY
jgi:predicted nucleotidyltransferase